MKTKTLEKWILLEQSGELSSRRQRLLEACPEAQAKREELNALRTAMPSPDAEPSPWAAARIAARLRGERRSILLPSRVWRPILALAACLTLVVSTWNFNQTSSSPVTVTVAGADVWNDQFEEDLTELESLILAISGDPLDIMEM